MSLNWSLILDVVMIAMMAATMIYAFTLNRNLERLKSVKTEFDATVQKLTLSITQAEKGLQDLKLTAQEVGGDMESRIADARGLAQELQFMIETADGMANRLSRAAEGSNVTKIETPKSAPSVPLVKAGGQPQGLFGSRPISTEVPPKLRSRAESQLMEDLNRVAAARAEKTRG